MHCDHYLTINHNLYMKKNKANNNCYRFWEFQDMQDERS